MKAISGFSFGAVAILLLFHVHSCLSLYSQTNSLIFQQSNRLTVNDKVSMSISIGGKPMGNIVFGLFTSIAPYTVKNFASLCIGNTTNAAGVVLSYKSSTFHRTIRNFMIQGGDFTRADGMGGESIYGHYFRDENFYIKHSGAGWLGMANAGPDTNGSQFYITCVLTQWLDNKHTLFGIVLEGMEIVRAIERNPTGANDKPILLVVITDCRMLLMNGPISVPLAPVSG